MAKKKLQGDNKKMISLKAFKVALLTGLLLSLPYYSTSLEAQDFKKASNPATVNASGSFTAGDGICANNTTGTITIDCTLLPVANFGSINLTSTTPPTNGFYNDNGARIAVAIGGIRQFFFANGSLGANGAAGAEILTSNSTCTAPVFIPDKAAVTTGFGGDGTHVCIITQGVTVLQIGTSGLSLPGTIPVVTGTGTPTITAGSSDTAGEVTSGASATSVIITFSGTKTNAPFCVVTSQTQLAIFSYTISTTAITITQTATSSEKIDYNCIQH